MTASAICRFLTMTSVLSLGCGSTPLDTSPPSVDGGARPVCTPGALRCNADGQRESCAGSGQWKASDFVCTVNVAVDDEIGSACATKADGRYRCWTADSLPPLPDGKYQRVQAARQGPIGLTQDGRIVAVGTRVPAALAPVRELRATNMWGNQALCYRTSADGSLNVFSDMSPELVAAGNQDHKIYDGPFRQATCAFEGLAAGVRPDGSAWANFAPVDINPSAGWKQIALSFGFFCGLRTDGAVMCGRFSSSQGSVPVTFPMGPYVQVATTNALGCALSVDGDLVCVRGDGALVPTPPGRYTFIDAGSILLCAIREDGTSGCWRHDGEVGPAGWDTNPSGFEAIVPAVDPEW